MEKQLYTCNFCKKEFEPKRRKIQKFCSNTCRSKNHHHKQQKEIAIDSKEVTNDAKKSKTKIEQISLQGVGNAALGSLVANTATTLVKEIFVPSHKKPATKEDIDTLKQIIEQRHLPITNYNDPFGRQAFYDKVTCQIVLFNKELNKMELPFISS